MNYRDTSGPAFPVTNKILAGHDMQGAPVYQEDVYFGMSLRDYFAGQAVAGLLADSDLNHGAEEFARRAYRVADAMLKAREEQGK